MASSMASVRTTGTGSGAGCSFAAEPLPLDVGGLMPPCEEDRKDKVHLDGVLTELTLPDEGLPFMLPLLLLTCISMSFIALAILELLLPFLPLLLLLLLLHVGGTPRMKGSSRGLGGGGGCVS